MSSAILREPIQSPSVWHATDHADPSVWTERLDEAERAEIRAALAHADATGRPMTGWSAADFPLPRLSDRVRDWAQELAHGRGFVLVKGFPVDLGGEAAGRAYYGLGLHWGTPVPQNKHGDVLGHVRDLGAPRTSPAVRIYTTRERQDFHTDGSDVVGLLCLSRARSGGESQIASSLAVYNEILRRRPDLVELLYEPVHWDRNDEQGPGEAPSFALPICAKVGERLRFFYIGWYIRDAQRHPEVPRLRPEQHQLLDLIEAIANDSRFRLEMDFEVGDVQFLNNATILHARNAYEDSLEPERKRHLLRLWLTAPTVGSVEDVLRGGIPQPKAPDPARDAPTP